MTPTATSVPIRVAARMARTGACAEMWLIETGYRRDAWTEIGLRPTREPARIELGLARGRDGALDLIDALGAPGSTEEQQLGRQRIVMPVALTCSDPWSPAQRSIPLPLPWVATIAMAAAKAVIADIGDHRRFRRECLPLVWLARSAGAVLDRRARLRAAPRSPRTPPRNVVALR